MNSYQDIINLTQRFLDGETSLDEESRLYDFFSLHEDLPEELAQYRDYFLAMGSMRPQTGLKTVSISKKHRYLRRASLAAAAAIALAIAATFTWRIREDTLLAREYAGSYIIVNGHRNDNLRQIRDSIRITLAEANAIESRLRGQSVIEKAEEEVLRSASPEQRKQLEELLN